MGNGLQLTWIRLVVRMCGNSVKRFPKIDESNKSFQYLFNLNNTIVDSTAIRPLWI